MADVLNPTLRKTIASIPVDIIKLLGIGEFTSYDVLELLAKLLNSIASTYDGNVDALQNWAKELSDKYNSDYNTLLEVATKGYLKEGIVRMNILSTEIQYILQHYTITGGELITPTTSGNTNKEWKIILYTNSKADDGTTNAYTISLQPLVDALGAISRLDYETDGILYLKDSTGKVLTQVSIPFANTIHDDDDISNEKYIGGLMTAYEAYRLDELYNIENVEYKENEDKTGGVIIFTKDNDGGEVSVEIPYASSSTGGLMSKEQVAALEAADGIVSGVYVPEDIKNRGIISLNHKSGTNVVNIYIPYATEDHAGLMNRRQAQIVDNIFVDSQDQLHILVNGVTKIYKLTPVSTDDTIISTVYGDISCTITYPDASANGGTINPTIVSISQTKTVTYQSGKIATTKITDPSAFTFAFASTGSSSLDVAATGTISNIAASTLGRHSIGEVTVTISGNDKTTSKAITIYQASYSGVISYGYIIGQADYSEISDFADVVENNISDYVTSSGNINSNPQILAYKQTLPTFFVGIEKGKGTISDFTMTSGIPQSVALSSFSNYETTFNGTTYIVYAIVVKSVSISDVSWNCTVNKVS